MSFHAQVRPSFSALPYYWSHKGDSLLAPQTQPISIPNQIFHHKKCSMAVFQISFNGHFIFKVLSAKSPGSPLPPTWHVRSVSRFFLALYSKYTLNLSAFYHHHFHPLDQASILSCLDYCTSLHTNQSPRFCPSCPPPVLCPLHTQSPLHIAVRVIPCSEASRGFLFHSSGSVFLMARQALYDLPLSSLTLLLTMLFLADFLPIHTGLLSVSQKPAWSCPRAFALAHSSV